MAVYILQTTLVLHLQNDAVLGVFSTPVASGSESRSEIEHKQLQLRYITILWVFHTFLSVCIFTCIQITV